MSNFFGYQDPNYTFHYYGISHIIPILVLFLLISLIYIFRDKLRTFKYEELLRNIFGAIMILNQMAYTYDNIYIGSQLNSQFAKVGKDLPLSLCGATMILCGFLLFNKKEKLFQVIYYWGLIGATMAILLPSAIANNTYGNYGPDKFRYYQFWIGHIGIISTLVYMMFVHQLKITKKSTVISFLWLMGFGLAVLWINNLLGSNYLFIQNPKETGLGFFPPYPWSAFAFAGLAAVFYFLFYLPWELKLNKR